MAVRDASNLVARHRRAEVRRYRALARAGAGQDVDGHADGVDGRLDAAALRERLAALPTDPDTLRRWAYRQARDITGAGLSEHGDVYAIFNGIVRDNVLPPALEAAIFRALKEVPGVTVETAEVAGRPALVVGQTEDWLREELLLDPETYAYRGERSTVTRDATIDPAKAGNAAGRIEKGQTVVIERIASAIVDEPGRRR